MQRIDAALGERGAPAHEIKVANDLIVIGRNLHMIDLTASSLTWLCVRLAICTMERPGSSSSFSSVRVNIEFGFSSVSLKRSSAD